MKLYHFTSAHHLPHIRRAGMLQPTESNVGSPVTHMPPWGSHRGPDVVWLLDTAELNGHPHGLRGSVYDKTEIRISLDIPRPVKWLDWEWTAMMHPDWRSAFVEAGGGPAAVEAWYVWPVPVRRSRWLDITDTRSGREIWRKDA